jgi:hypothetical protein
MHEDSAFLDQHRSFKGGDTNGRSASTLAQTEQSAESWSAWRGQPGKS